MALFGLFGGGKPTFKPAANQTIEIEFEDVDGKFQSYFVEVLEVAKRRLTLAMPGNDMNPVSVGPGMPIIISYFDEGKNTYFTYEGVVKDSREREFDVDPPPSKKTTSIEVEPRDEAFKVEVALPVKYQAHRSVHSQVANTHAVTPHSLFLRTNLAIPPETPLRLVLEIPNAPHIDIDGKAVGSEKDPEDNRKHISEVQFENIDFEDRDKILSYSIYYRQRRIRAQERGEE